MKKQSKQKGITLVALVITIVILLILAGITINSLTDSGLFGKTKEAKEKYSKAEIMEKIQMEVLASYDNNGDLDIGKVKDNITKNIDGATIKGNEFPIIVTVEGEKFIVNENGEVSYKGKGDTVPVDPEEPEPPVDPTVATNPATNITEAQSNYMLTKTVNSPIEDANGNKITIPAGFKMKVDADTNNATTADKGIVIIDSNENEFVWIPVPELVEMSDGTKEGRVYTNTEKTEYKTVELNRYTFDSSGNPTSQDDAEISRSSYKFQELQTPSNVNTPAKSITNFKQSVSNNKGYYIGRYEARTGTERNSSNKATLTPITEKGENFVYNLVTQMQAAELAQGMYDNTKPFTSDLMNSYAWDTATLFLQKCGENQEEPYSMQSSINTKSDGLAATGTNNGTKKDVKCNIYDIASNVNEWSTETCINANSKGVYRGGAFDNNTPYASYRGIYSATSDDISIGFRPLLYF